MVMQFPPYPRHLTADERRALLMQTARDLAEASIREAGLDPAKVRDTLTADAMTAISIAWLNDRVAALEAARVVRKARG